MERRRAVRVPAGFAVEIRNAGGFSLFSSSDVSTGGLFFDRAIPHAVGEQVELLFTLPGETEPIRCLGEVANVPDAHAFGMGVRFVDLDPASRARVDAFVRDYAKQNG